MSMKKWLVVCIQSFIFISTAQSQVPDISVLKLKAPETFRAKFTTNKGDFVIEAYRKWAPIGVDRLYQLIKTGFYDNVLLFRVERNFVAQFGISDDEPTNRFWDPKKIVDEPLKYKNSKGVIAYARGGPNSRCTQLFINMVDNPKNDTAIRLGVKGFTPIARVIKGMDIVVTFNDRYGRTTVPQQDSIYKYGNRYFEKRFPGLDKIISARIIK
jgi:peptidyl-prolyl cis-trans isomerase A (cyclophilin A)